MGKQLKTYSLPYSYLYGAKLVISECNWLTGLGNYAVGELFINDFLLKGEETWFISKDKYISRRENLDNFYNFMCNTEFDCITRNEYEYITDETLYNQNINVFSHIADLFSLNYDFLWDKIISSNSLQLYANIPWEVRDSYFTGDPFKKTRFESVTHFPSRNIVEVVYYQDYPRNKTSKSFNVIPSFYKCFMCVVKAILIYRIFINKEYHILRTGKFYFDCFDVYIFKRVVDEFKYIKIIP